jgi:hypothetical protein
MQQLEGKGEFGALQTVAASAVEVIDFFLKPSEIECTFGEEALRCKLLKLFMFKFFEEEILLNVGELFVEVIGEVVSEEFLEEEGLDLGEDVNAALLAVEGFELGVVAWLVPLLLHPPLSF